MSAPRRNRMTTAENRAAPTPTLPSPACEGGLGRGHSGPLGIIAGNGGLPARLIESCRAAGREVFVLALEGEADRAAVERVPHAWCRLRGGGGRVGGGAAP